MPMLLLTGACYLYVFFADGGLLLLCFYNGFLRIIVVGDFLRFVKFVELVLIFVLVLNCCLTI